MTLSAQTFSQLITFARSTTGTRTNATGLIETIAANQPRFDLDPVTGLAQGILLEEARTNLLTYSDQLDNAAWAKANTTIGINVTASKDGTLNADKIQETAATAYFYVSQAVTPLTASTTYRYSFYAKAAERSVVWSEASGTDFVVGGAIFDLVAVTATAYAGSPNPKITSVGNGWFRCELNCVTAATITGSATILTGVSSSSVRNYAGTAGSGAYVWGAQFEAGSFSTSYIPTTTAQVARAADLASVAVSSIPQFSSAAGSLVLAFSGLEGVSATQAGYFASFGTAATTTNRMSLFVDSTSHVGLEVESTGAIATPSVAILGGTNKLAFTYQAGSMTFCANGGAVATLSKTVPSVASLFLGNLMGDGTYAANCRIKSVSYYPGVLTNAQLQAATL